MLATKLQFFAANGRTPEMRILTVQRACLLEDMGKFEKLLLSGIFHVLVRVRVRALVLVLDIVPVLGLVPDNVPVRVRARVRFRVRVRVCVRVSCVVPSKDFLGNKSRKL